ncbi:urease accessory protein UreF [Echinimonas agarilytica]|uniref:Urease accessory protein UreF n=1 Tax=Echinimonas agarilytica TaxID=1215918 RepID=A0AA41W5P9_9GAMM|nr:urease accessory UreF family protein [Echinimonas agarilytica]MCM2679160.1 urease accessory protein UreF [Echinimonas agarilytica]
MHIQALLSLMHLTSPSLPIGAFAYSQGLETAVELEWISDEESLQRWLRPLMRFGQANLEIPIIQRCYDAWKTDDLAQLNHWQDILLANRETAELVKEEQKLGQTFYRLLDNLNVEMPECAKNYSYLVLFACAIERFNIDLEAALSGWLWSWLENQITVACKTIPLGQTPAQLSLVALMPDIEASIQHGLLVSDDDIGLTLPSFAMVSAWHETQYSRLFRS